MTAPATCSWAARGGLLEPAAAIPLSDRGLRYGMGLFETLRIRQGRAEFLDAHLALLARSCGETGIPLRAAGLPDAPALRRLAATLPDGRLRILLTAGDGGPCDPVTQPRAFLFFEESPGLSPARYEEGYHLSAPIPADRSVHRHLKTLNYWDNIAALQTARQGGFDEAILLSHQSRVKSAAMANLFLYLDGQWVTPPESDGARPGVVRQEVLALTRAAVRPLDPAELPSAAAAFLTSSGLGVMPVRSIAGRRLSAFGQAAAVRRAFEDSGSQ